MGSDAANDIEARLRDAIEHLALRNLQSRPGTPVADAYRESLLAVFSEEIAAAPPGAAIETAEAYGRFIGLTPRADSRSAFRLESDGGTSRKNAGAYYTPAPLVELVLQSTLDPLLDRAAALRPASAREPAFLSLRVCDPACGVGHFLAPAARRIALRLAKVRSGDDDPSLAAVRTALADVTDRCIFGADIDPAAAAICRAVLRAEAGLDPSATGPLETHIAVADSLAPATWAHRPAFDAVIGNPPFVNAIEGGIEPRTRDRLRKLYPELGALADLSHYFLALAARLAARTGTVGLILPRSVLGSESAAVLRAGMPPWLRPNLLYAPPGGRLFDGADIFICAVALGPADRCRVGLAGAHGRTRWRTTTIRDDNWWRAMHAGNTPPRTSADARLGEAFEVRSNMFINDAYLLRDYLVDDADGPGPKLVTTGLIEPRDCLWGRTPCRYLGRDYAFPRVRTRRGLPPSLARRLTDAGRPKVLIAGLAGRIECFLDSRAEFIGSVGTYAIYHPDDDVTRLEQVSGNLLTPAASRLFRSTLGANALAGGNIGLRAGFLREFPLTLRAPSRAAP